MAGDLEQVPILHRKLAYSLYSKLKIPLAPAILFATEKIFALLLLSPKSLYGNFSTRNVRCHNKEIVALLFTDVAARYWLRRIASFYGLYRFSIILIYIHLRFVICDKSTKIMLAKREQRCFLFSPAYIFCCSWKKQCSYSRIIFC